MSGNVYTYDPSQVIVIVGGVPMSGFSEGSKVKMGRDVDAFKKYVGVDGDTTRAKSGNRAGRAEISLAQSSPSNDVLSGFAIADEVSNTGVVPVLVTDLSGRTKIATAKGWVKKIPDADLGADVKDVVWIIDCASIDILVGGNAVA